MAIREEGDTTYKAEAMRALTVELLSPFERERLGRAPAWVRSIVTDLLKRILNLRAMLERAKEA